jgi:hypothetical protein
MKRLFVVAASVAMLAGTAAGVALSEIPAASRYDEQLCRHSWKPIAASA